MDFGSESDAVSVCESKMSIDDQCSLDDISVNNFLNVTFKKTVSQ